MPPLGPAQTSKFTSAESNANKQNLLFLLISIRFGTCGVRRLNRALVTELEKTCQQILDNSSSKLSFRISLY